MFKKYFLYLQDNPNEYWFKRKVYGWGWTPVKWQGWFSLFVYLAFFFYLAKKMNIALLSGGDSYFVFAGFFVVVTAILIFVCYKKGEKPKWQWGIKDEEKDKKDKS